MRFRFPILKTISYFSHFSNSYQMENLLTVTQDYFDMKRLIIVFVVFISIVMRNFWAIKNLKNQKIKKYIQLNYTLSESELTKAEQDLIRVTYDNTIQNKKAAKVCKGDSDSKKKTAKIARKVSFVVF